MVYKCEVWWRQKVGNLGGDPVPSAAYGLFKERATIEEAMRDKVALRLTSMKHAQPAGPFFATVIEYPQGHPPQAMQCELFFSLGGDDGS